MRLENVVPWGRSLWEYTHMFDLTDADLSAGRLLGVGDGPASFNAELHSTGRRVVSVDPLYVFSAGQIRARVHATHDLLVRAAREHADEFTWQHLTSPEQMGEVRLAAMERFLLDYPAGRRDGRYLAAALPSLPFTDRQFNMALCSHLLFLYTEQLSLAFHVAGILEMARVAEEVRIFPLTMLGSLPSPHLEPVRQALVQHDCVAEVRRVPYEFQKGGNAMLVVRRRR